MFILIWIISRILLNNNNNLFKVGSIRSFVQSLARLLAPLEFGSHAKAPIVVVVVVGSEFNQP